ncbi:MAG: sulfite exporter TauE/SafE family protein [Chloroflexota bacterium]
MTPAHRVSILTGMAMGMTAGLLGVGGGIVGVPMMTIFLALTQREAHGTSLAAMVPAAVFGVIQYTLNGYADWGLAASLAVGSIVGVTLGARLMMKISPRQLRRVFGCFLLVVAFRLLVGSWWFA